MKSRTVCPMIAIQVSITFLLMMIVVGTATAQGNRPSNATQEKVEKGTAGIPGSGIISITFVGNKKFTSEQLLKVVEDTGLTLGIQVNASVIAPAMKALVDYYKANGANLSASPDIIEDPKGFSVVQFIIDEDGTKGDVGGLVSSGGPQIFYP